MNQILFRHRNELAQALRNFHFEPTGDGQLHLPKQGLFFGGVFTTTVNGRDERVDANTMTTEGLRDLIIAYLPLTTGRGTVPTAAYLVPYVNDTTPADSLTAANFHGIMAEFTNYTQATRPQWSGVSASGVVATNTAAPATFTINTGGGTIRGMALSFASAKLSTSTKILCCSAFGADRVMLAGDELKARYDITAVDA